MLKILKESDSQECTDLLMKDVDVNTAENDKAAKDPKASNNASSAEVLSSRGGFYTCGTISRNRFNARSKDGSYFFIFSSSSSSSFSSDSNDLDSSGGDSVFAHACSAFRYKGGSSWHSYRSVSARWHH